MLSDVYESVSRFRIHLQRQNDSVGQYGAELGLIPAQVTELQEDAALSDWIPGYCDEINDCKETATGVKARFFNTDDETPAGAFKTAPDATPPFEIKAGAIKRSKERDRLMLANKPSEAAMIAMDLGGDTSQRESPEDVKPSVVYEISDEAYTFDATVRNIGEADLKEIQIRRLDQEKWESVKTGTGRTITASITPTEEGKSERIEVRIRLFRKDKPYGQPSDPQYVTLNP